MTYFVVPLSAFVSTGAAVRGKDARGVGIGVS